MAEKYRPLYPKVDHYWCKVAHNYEPLALHVDPWLGQKHGVIAGLEGTLVGYICVRIWNFEAYLGSQGLIILGYLKPIMVYFGV